MRPRLPSRPAGDRRRTVAVALAVGLAVGVAAGVGAAVLVDDPDEARPRDATATSTPLGATAHAPSAESSTPAAAVSTPPAARAAGTLPRVQRLAAPDPHALSAAASRATFPGTQRVPVVYLVADDALDVGWAAVPAAAARGGAVLLTRADELPHSTAKELERLEPTEVVVVGDAAAVSEKVAEAARGLASRVVRVDHAAPGDAARVLTRAAFPQASAAWVASADRTADLAVAAAAAAARGSPLIVVDGDAAVPAAADVALLRNLRVTRVTVVGGTGAVAEGVERGLTQALPAGSVERLRAADRAALAATVHTHAWGGATPVATYVANPDRPPDAFTGAFLAGAARASLHWALPYCLPAPSRSAVVAPTVARVTVIGGERTIRSSVDRLERCRSIEDASSAWVLVNKRNRLSPGRFVPTDLVEPAMEHANGHRLRADAATALAEMASASVQAGAGRIGIDTAFRSYETQESLYAETLARRGRTWTDRWYLRPGHSEHQTGLTVDLLPVGRSDCTVNDCIDETPQGAWLAEHSWRFGYLLRYERGHTPTTGVGFEPWHFRYVGRSLARAYHDGGWDTYEEFLGEPAAPTY